MTLKRHVVSCPCDCGDRGKHGGDEWVFLSLLPSSFASWAASSLSALGGVCIVVYSEEHVCFVFPEPW